MSTILGIDFGGQNACVMTVRDGHTVCVLNAESKRQTPTVVSMEDEHREIGTGGFTSWKRNYKNTISELKRFIGTNAADKQIETEKDYIFNANKLVAAEGDGATAFECQYLGEKKVIRNEQAYGMMLGNLADLAATEAKLPPILSRTKFQCCISVPGYFTDKQRRAVLAAAQIANIHCLRVMNDTTALALKYGFKEQREMQTAGPGLGRTVMFVDIGYSDYSVSIAKVFVKSIKVLAEVHERNIGGRNIDLLLAKYFASKASAQQGNPLEKEKSKLKLIMACEKLKKKMSSGVPKGDLYVECLFPSAMQQDLRGSITKEDFEGMIQPLADGLKGPLEKALANAGLKAEDLHSVELVGGSSRIPLFKNTVKKFFGDSAKVVSTLNADEAVADGCTLQAAILSPLISAATWKVQDVCPSNVEVSWDQPAGDDVAAEKEGAAADDKAAFAAGKDGKEEDVANVSAGGDGVGESVTLFKEGDAIPVTRRVAFRRSAPFSVTAKDKETGEVLTSAAVSGMEGTTHVMVNIRYDINGTLAFTSAEKLTAVATTAAEGGEGAASDAAAGAAPTYKRAPLGMELTTPGSLDAKAVQQFTEAELEMCNVDRLKKETDEARNSCEAFCYKIRDELEYGELKQFAEPEQAKQILAKASETGDWLYSDESDEFKKKDYVERLKSITDMCSDIYARQKEVQARPAVQSQLMAMIERYVTTANSTAEMYAHITEEERNTVRTKCQEVQEWVYAQQKLQGDKPLYEAPVYTVKDLQDKGSELRKECDKVVNKPKPEPKKDEAKADETTEGETKAEAKTDADGDAEMGAAEEEAKPAEGEAKPAEEEAAAAAAEGGDAMETE